MKNKNQKIIIILIAVILIALAFIIISQPAQSTKETKESNVTLENGVQVAHMTESASGYTPNSFTLKRGVPANIIVEAKDPYSCASVLIVPKYKIREFLKAGENTISFTPQETGPIKFACSMGMYTGTFNVID
ncbi:MAG: cupredoxin domain-containing protein [Candidatus Falkowbacteria bacterium]